LNRPLLTAQNRPLLTAHKNPLLKTTRHNLALGLPSWFTNGNIIGSRAFDGTDGRFTNVAINAVTNAQVFFQIQVP